MIFTSTFSESDENLQPIFLFLPGFSASRNFWTVLLKKTKQNKKFLKVYFNSFIFGPQWQRNKQKIRDNFFFKWKIADIFRSVARLWLFLLTSLWTGVALDLLLFQYAIGFTDRKGAQDMSGDEVCGVHCNTSPVFLLHHLTWWVLTWSWSPLLLAVTPGDPWYENCPYPVYSQDLHVQGSASLTADSGQIFWMADKTWDLRGTSCAAALKMHKTRVTLGREKVEGERLGWWL